MRQPAPRFLLLIFMALFVSSTAFADARSEARVHYQQGQKLYAAGDYRGAITSFSAAQQLMPADLNNYNLALCYDKLGEAEPAIQYYREFLNKQPNVDKRAEIEASIARLEAALKSASAKRSEEARKAEEARKVEEARRLEEARKTQRPVAPPVAPPVDPNAGPGGGASVGVGAGVGVGSTGVPSTGQTVSTGDAQLDRAASVDINGIRDQRVGGAASGIADPAAGPQGNPQAAANPNAPQPPANGVTPPADQPPKKATPVYKKWWFWAVVAVSAYVVYSIASEGSSEPTRARELPDMGRSPSQAPGGGGMTLLRF